MLEPTTRELFLTALAPPAGFSLDRAVGTTYSLDLQALLAVPLALTFANCEGADGEPIRDPIALLEALRRLTNRFSIFTQAGGIHLPPIDQRLFAFLEGSVVEVAAPSAGAAFHPKAWALRFTDGDQDVLYRVLIMTRNLTFDRCWDAMVVLDGRPGRWRRGDPDPRPIADFIAAQPGLAVRPVQEHQQETVALMADELRSTSFVMPEGVETLTFHSLGLGGRPIDFVRRIDRLLVMSPFVTNGFLRGVLAGGRRDILITRPDEVVALNADTISGVQLFGLDERSDPEPTEDDPTVLAGAAPLSGLHAKLIIADAGRKATMWLGSANATTAGHSGNVEFVVEMLGAKGKFGIDVFLGEEGKRGFRSLLVELDPGACTGEAPALQAGERQLSTWAVDLAAMQIQLDVHETEPDEFGLRLLVPGCSSELAQSGCMCRCWLSSLPDTRSVPLPLTEIAQAIDLPAVSLAALTAFLDIELTPPAHLELRPAVFAIRVDLIGAPEDRPQRVLRSLLETREQVLRYLLMLLAGPDVAVASLVGATDGDPGSWAFGGFASAGLFERMLSALARDPAELHRVASLVQDLQNDGNGAERLPEGFMPIWEAVWSVAGTTVKT